jgi:Mg2+ and Co2+ transporter CorA
MAAPQQAHALKAYLYDALGKDKEVDVPASLPELAERNLLWLSVIGRDTADLERAAAIFKLRSETIAAIREKDSRPALHSHGDYFACNVIAVGAPEKKEGAALEHRRRMRLDFVVGENWIVTVADEELPFLEEFREDDRGESLIGQLSAASLMAAMLDAHLSQYLASLENLEVFADELDVHMLAMPTSDETLLQQLVAARRFVSRLRRGLAPQHAIFYGLARPDFELVEKAGAAEHFHALQRRFERTVDAIEHGRELVQGSFDLLTARTATITNTLIRRLTFLGLSLGAVGAVAGIFGMNFQTPYADSGLFGFWAVIVALGVVIVAGAIVGQRRGWI